MMTEFREPRFAAPEKVWGWHGSWPTTMKNRILADRKIQVQRLGMVTTL
jgi:hypothetical protein